MATDVFPIYDILVESIFGSVGVAIMGVALVLILILLISRSTGTFIAYWMLFYFMVMGTIYIGAIGLIFAFLIGFGLTAYNVIKLFTREG